MYAISYPGPVPKEAPYAASEFSEVYRNVAWYRDFFREQGHPLGYFAALYAKVSARVEQAMAEGAFARPDLLQRMDVLFVTEYLRAMHQYLHGQPARQVWRCALKASERPEVSVLQHLLIALNAHVHLDLPVATGLACPGEEVQEFKQDFMFMNDLLYDLMDAVQRDLGQVFWPIYLWNRLMGRADDRIIGIGLKGARHLAWKQAEMLAMAPTEKYRLGLVAELDQRFVGIGQRLAEPRNPLVRLGMRWMYWREKGSVADKIDRLTDD